MCPKSDNIDLTRLLPGSSSHPPFTEAQSYEAKEKFMPFEGSSYTVTIKAVIFSVAVSGLLLWLVQLN